MQFSTDNVIQTEARFESRLTRDNPRQLKGAIKPFLSV